MVDPIATEGRTVREVLKDLKTELKEQFGLEIDEYASDMTRYDPSLPREQMWEGTPTNCPSPFDYTALWPERYSWIACFAVTGGSEGHYVHVSALVEMKDGKYRGFCRERLLILIKTFEGMEFATRMASACTQLLGA